MGCTECSGEYTNEELEFLKKEIKLPYGSLRLGKIESVHRKYAVDGKISQTDWNNIKSELNFTSKTDKFSRLFDSFYHDEFYSMRGLLTLGILVSFGNVGEKAKILFELIDVESKGFLKKEDLEVLIDECMEISINKIALIVDMEKFNLQEYVGTLIKNKSRAKEKIIKIIWKKNKEKILFKEFTKRFYRKKAVCLLNSAGIRKFIYKINYFEACN